MKENSKITIYQSGGKKKNKMSDFTGKDFESIRSELEEKYKQVTINYIENDRPKGEIVEQIPTPDQMVVEAEQDLKIWVSNYIKLDQVTFQDGLKIVSMVI